MESLREKARIFWMVKGYLPDDRTIESAYPGYVKRLWWNEEAYLRADGFEEAYNEWKYKEEKDV